MVRKYKKKRPSGGGESGIGSGPSSTVGGESVIGSGPPNTVSLWIPKPRGFLPGDSLKRPGFVSFGESCNVKANYLKQLSFSGNLHRYSVSICPKPKSSGVNRDVMRKVVIEYGKSHLGGRLTAYDGTTKLYTSDPFPFTSESYKVREEDNLEVGKAPQRCWKLFRVNISLDAILSGGSDCEELCQAFNAILHEMSTGSYYPVGRSFYLPLRGEGFKNCFGLYQSTQYTQMGISLNIDISYKSFIKPLPVIDFVAQLLSRDISDRPFNETELLQIKNSLLGKKVNVTLQGNMHRTYCISGLTSHVASELWYPVQVDHHGTTRVVQYFKEKYGYNIRHNLPCLQFVDQQGATYLPMEVCEMADRQHYSKQSNKKQISCQHPVDHQSTILQTVKPDIAKEFGLIFESKLKIVEGRVLPPPMLKFHHDGKEKEFLPKAGKWNMRFKKMVDGGVVNNWTCINFASDVMYTVASSFCDELVVKCLVSGMNFKVDPVLPLAKASPKYVESVLKKHHRRVMKILRPQGQEFDLLIVILPDNNGTLYGDIKRICETDIGLVSQCCLAKHVLKMKPKYLANIALKINVKAGGRNTVLRDAVERKLPRVSNTPTIIFGADVSHPHPGERHCSPSIAAVVASQDWPEVTKYAGLVRPQAHREEIIQGLFDEDNSKSGMIKDHIISFMRATGHIPGRIIFYRDVVSKGRLNQVLEHELSSIKKACASLDPIYNPQVTIIMVQKSHHTRLFGVGSTLFESGNVLPGTVVDKEICHPTDFDFYLCSHAGTKGVSRPVHYHVLWDENNFTANALQSLTNHLCYTYARCTSSISIVPPIRYAHLLASRARLYIKPGDGELSFPDIKDNVKKRSMFFC